MCHYSKFEELKGYRKVREVKETTAEKLAQQRAKVKKAIIDAKDFVFTKIKDKFTEIRENDRKKYNFLKDKFNAGVHYIQTKPGEIKQAIMDEYNQNHGGRSI